jgi:outer membrane protein assembly factor BamC
LAALLAQDQEIWALWKRTTRKTAKLPQDRNTIGKIFGSLYSTGDATSSGTRLERRPDGITEIYVSHRVG